MKILAPSATILRFTPDLEVLIEEAGRTCYKSEDRITANSAPRFIEDVCMKRQHESVMEHGSITVRFICDRGISHELVRHRLASFSQESTRYVSSINIKDEKVDEPQEVVDYYVSGLSMRRISELSRGKYSEWDIYKILDGADIERRPLGNTGVVNHTFFDQIDTVEKAYLLGMIQADGSLRRDAPQVSITQHEDYAWYLHRMVSDLIRPNANTNKDKRCRQISFTSPQLHSALINMGVVPNKSYDQTEENIDQLWSAVPPLLIPSFLRGFLDGDGGVRFFQQNNPGQTESCNINWTGHHRLLEKISDWLNSTFGYKPVVRPVAGTRNLHQVAVTNPRVGFDLVQLMLVGFRWPYGHPAKTARMIEQVGGDYPFAEFGDPKFQVIHPGPWIEKSPTSKFLWLAGVDSAERAYSRLRLAGATPQEARSVLPHSLKTELVMTANPREWRHIFKLRTAKEAHPQMREIMTPLAADFAKLWPSMFGEWGQ